MRAPAALLLVAVLSSSAAGCGGEDEQRRRASVKAKSPDALTCGELRRQTARRRVARRVVDRLVAPAGQSRRSTARMVEGSLRVTCSQPELPGVRDPAAYRPVGPVLKALQVQLDEEEILHE